MTRMFRAVTAGVALTLAGGTAMAENQSDYGCRLLDQAQPQALLEGRDGVFFRTNLDMRTYHALSPQAVESIAALSEALEERGTQLIYLPVPTKSLAMPEHLPGAVAEYGYDRALAETAYDGFLAKFDKAGVQVADTLPALQATDGPFIGTDFHWTPQGARAAAGAVAEVVRAAPGYEDAPKTPHRTEKTGEQSIPSVLRRRLQEHCRDAVPPARIDIFSTEAEATTPGDGGGGIFAEDSAGPALALVGTSMSAEPNFNFAGFLAEATDLTVTNYAITGGNQFGSITSYLLSEDFQQAPPAFLIWENPIYNNLGEFGALPLMEIIAAARDDCQEIALDAEGDNRTLKGSLPEDIGPEALVRIDTGRANGRTARFRFATADGLEIAAAVTRPPRFEPTRWFYQPLAPLGRSDFAEVTVETDQPLTDSASLALCKSKGAQS